MKSLYVASSSRNGNLYRKMYKLSVIIFLNCLILYVSVEEKTNTSQDVNISVEPIAPVETNDSAKTDIDEETKPTILRNSLLVTKQRAENELTEIDSNQVLPLVLFPIFDQIKQTNTLHFPQNIDDASVLEKRIVKGTKFTINTELIERMQGLKKTKGMNKIQETYFCPKKISDYECFALQIFRKSEKLQCALEATPQVKLLGQGEIKCGPNGIGIAYEVVYNICPNNSAEEVPQYETTEMKFYTFCYHAQTRRNLHTSHSIISPKLLYSNVLYRERNVKYSMIQNELTLSNHENLDNSSNKEQKFDPSTLPGKPAYRLQKLVPSGDMAFALWMKTTFESINFEWQHEKITPLWNKINDYVKSDAIRMFFHSQTIYHVETAVVDTTFGKSATQDDDQMSNLWVKMVYTTRTSPNSVGIIDYEGIAIFANNFIAKTVTNSKVENESENVSTADTVDTSSTTQSAKENDSEKDPNVIAENAETKISKKENYLANYCTENLCPVLDEQFIRIGSRARCCPISAEIVDIFGLANFKTDMPMLQINGIW